MTNKEYLDALNAIRDAPPEQITSAEALRYNEYGWRFKLWMKQHPKQGQVW